MFNTISIILKSEPLALMLDQVDVARNFQHFSKFLMEILYPISVISVFLDISEIATNCGLWLLLSLSSSSVSVQRFNINIGHFKKIMFWDICEISSTIHQTIFK